MAKKTTKTATPAPAAKRKASGSKDVITVNFTLERETPGAVRYMEVDDNGEQLEIADGAKIGTLYIRKSALGGGIPDSIEIVITPK